MRGEETLDELRRYGLKVIQPRHGYRFSLDPLLLCDFAAVQSGDRVVDLGAGCGIMPLIMAATAGDVHVTGVELQQDMAALALRNAELNGMSGRIDIICRDILDLKGVFPPSAFDLVIANPPFRKRGTGRVSPKPGRDDARHESTATLADFLVVAKKLVKLSGRICFISHPVRLVELLTAANDLKLSPLRLRLVHGSDRAEARMFLLELVKGRRGDLKIAAPLLVYGPDGKYTAEAAGILGTEGNLCDEGW